ncbi:MAG: hypothetical protein WCP19_11040 [Chloroflexota bacterium]
MHFQAEFYTFDHVIRGLVNTTLDRLCDLLNLKNETTVIVRDAQISRLSGLGNSEPNTLTTAKLEKSSILFAYPAEMDMSTNSIFRRVTRQVFPVLVILPNFEISGQIHLTEKFDIHRVLLSRTEDFIPLTNSTVVYSTHPNVIVTRSTIVFNKNYLVLIGERQITDDLLTPSRKDDTYKDSH